MSKLYVKFRIWCLIGLLLSIYASYVELKSEKDADYVAMCDISPKVSCTAVFTSTYGRGFGLTQFLTGDASPTWNPPNGVLGIGFYILLLILCFGRRRWLSLLQVALCVVANMLSVYLAYLLYFVLDDLCVICVSIYVVNYVCLVESWRIYQQLKQGGEENAINEREAKFVSRKMK